MTDSRQGKVDRNPGSMAALEQVTDDPVASAGVRAVPAAGQPLPDEMRLARTEQLLDEHHDTVYRYAYRLTGCSASAEDITQEVFLRAFRGLHQLRQAGAERGWLLVIARNEFARWCKKSSPKLSLEANDSWEVEADEAGRSLERTEWVQRALEQLPREFRLVVLMFYFEQFSYAEIAEQLDVPIGTVMSRLSRGRSHLKKALDGLAQPNRSP